MQVFKCALRILRAHIVFPLIYIIGFSFMSVIIASSIYATPTTGSFSMSDVSYSVIDRDNSEISRGIGEYLGREGKEVVVADDDFAMQDAIAKGLTDYMLIIPEGYGEKFVDAARRGADEPKLEAVFSSVSVIGIFVDQYINEYATLMRNVCVAYPDYSETSIVNSALEYVGERADVSMIELPTKDVGAEPLIFYFVWCAFTLFSGVFICIAVMVGSLSRTNVRKRTSVSPLSRSRDIAEMSLACISVAIAALVWTFVVGLVFFSEAAVTLGVSGLILCAIAMLVFTLFPLALGLFLARLGMTLLTCNAIAVLIGQFISFFSGAWVSYEIMSSEVKAIAHLTPGYWYANACNFAIAVGASADLSFESIIPYLQDLGVLFVFAAIFFALTFIKKK